MGHLTTHMLQHLALMNLVVPLAILIFRGHLHQRWLARSWPWATAAQIVLLWSWHSPAALGAAMASPVLMILMHASLAATAAFFWGSIAAMTREESWRALIALLVTGKLFCLLGALLVFSPNQLFELGMAHHHPMGAQMLADQQMAGMLMLIACPLSYVAAGIALAGRWFFSLEQDGRAHG
ncbi:cytochrome c oxidase assembly protein [Devosia sp. CAU 1758]